MVLGSSILLSQICWLKVILFHLAIRSSLLATLFTPSARLLFLAPLLVA
jgi:hypothetical protein